MPALATKTPPRRLQLPGAGHLEVSQMPDQAYKRCVKCGETKPLEDFYRKKSSSDGRWSECKDCTKARKREYERNNRDKVNARKRRSRQRNIDTHRKAYQRRVREQRAQFPERRRANIAVRRAIDKGQLSRPATCEDCGAGGKIDAHHDDYDKRLEVRWLCKNCHYVADTERREREALSNSVSGRESE